MKFTISSSLFDEIAAHALASFPEECCGLVVERDSELQVQRVTNIQNEKHDKDPEAFPRTARTAYSMGPEAAPILVAHGRGDLTVRAFYHSHPQHDAYFSDEDKLQATVWDEPSYPDAAQIVVSVYDGAIKETKAFQWSEGERDFVEIELQIDNSRSSN